MSNHYIVYLKLIQYCMLMLILPQLKSDIRYPRVYWWPSPKFHEKVSLAGKTMAPKMSMSVNTLPYMEKGLCRCDSV